MTDGPTGAAVVVLLRPDAASPLALPGAVDLENVVTGTLRELSFRGSQIRIEVETANDIRLRFELPAKHAAALPAKGEAVALRIDPAGIDILPDLET